MWERDNGLPEGVRLVLRPEVCGVQWKESGMVGGVRDGGRGHNAADLSLTSVRLVLGSHKWLRRRKVYLEKRARS